MAKHNETGRKGEDIAVEYLEREGYVILERNWRRQHAEIDIIISDKRSLVFVEVKTRRSDVWGLPEDAVSKRKMNQIIKGASLYIEENNIGDLEPRFDIISVILSGSKIEIQHIDDAFYPTLN